MPLTTDPYWTELKLRAIRPATTGSPMEYIYAREIPPADPVEAKLDTIIRQNAKILALLGWDGQV